MGRRPDELRRGVGSLMLQRDVEFDVVVVGNSWEPVGLPDGVRALGLPDNVGIPAGRNQGVPLVGGDLLFFLDDDAWLRDEDTLARLQRLFEAEPDLGLVQLHIANPDGGPEPRRWVPRLRVGDHDRSSDVTAVWEGAVAVRRELFEAIGGWPGDFFYAHEGIDLAWQVIDRGYRVRYLGDVTAYHPVVPVARHDFAHYLSARNRVLLARRHLPLPFAVAYTGTWFVLNAIRVRSPREARKLLRGYRDGLRMASPRSPFTARTIWRMTRAGRPPII